MTSPEGPALWPIAERAPGRIDVAGLGEVSLDEVGVLMPGSEFGDKRGLSALVRRPGGTIASAILGCQRLGLVTALVAAVGTDAEGEAALAPLAAAGVDLTRIEYRRSGQTRRAFIAVDPTAGTREVYAYRSHRLNLDPAGLDRRPFQEARAVLLDASDPGASEWAAVAAAREGLPVILDADRPFADCERLLSRVSFPIVGEALAQHLGGGQTRAGLETLRDLGAHFAVATCGARGSLALGPDGFLEAPAFAVPVVDSTGAGDAFRAGFVTALLGGAGPATLLQRANACGALNCRKAGAQEALPTADELERFLADVG
ncbi:MAG: carbohydrate kinase family protein [Myxococcota bacterium]